MFRDRSNDGRLPWDIIDGGLKSGFFRTELEKATRPSGRSRPSGGRNARLLGVAGREKVTALAHGSRFARLPVSRLFTRGLRFMIGVRLENRSRVSILRRRVAVRPKQREGAAFAVDRILARRKRHVPAAAGAAPRRRSQ